MSEEEESRSMFGCLLFCLRMLEFSIENDGMDDSPTPKLTGVSPARVVDAVAGIPELSRNSYIQEHFQGLQIRAAGIIMSFEDILHCPYATVHFYNGEDAFWIRANFLKPLPPEVELLQKGDYVEVLGRIFNIHNRAIVLDECTLQPTAQPRPQSANAQKTWPEKWWGSYTIQVAAGVTVIILVALFGLWWKFWHH
jgi:hypothetical protein